MKTNIIKYAFLTIFSFFTIYCTYCILRVQYVFFLTIQDKGDSLYVSMLLPVIGGVLIYAFIRLRKMYSIIVNYVVAAVLLLIMITALFHLYNHTFGVTSLVASLFAQVRENPENNAIGEHFGFLLIRLLDIFTLYMSVLLALTVALLCKTYDLLYTSFFRADIVINRRKGRMFWLILPYCLTFIVFLLEELFTHLGILVTYSLFFIIVVLIVVTPLLFFEKWSVKLVSIASNIVVFIWYSIPFFLISFFLFDKIPLQSILLW